MRVQCECNAGADASTDASAGTRYPGPPRSLPATGANRLSLSGLRTTNRRVIRPSTASSCNVECTCPFCMTMFEDGIKGAGYEETLQPKDITELLVERLPVV